MNVALWVAAGLLAVIYLAAGLPKLTKPKEALVDQMSWAADFSARSVHAIGALEVLGAVGVVLPGLVRIAPVLVPLAAVGLALLQVGAAVVNVRYQETNRLPLNIVLFALAVFVAWGRFGPYPL
jgi:uncharacterized membrane protein YphA (DoxX/SURF4 family)